MKIRRRLKAVVMAALCVLSLGAWGGCAGVKRFMYEGIGRDDWQKPAEVIAALAVRPGDQVADVGAGGGYFTIPLARSVGETGRVFAVDVEADMVEYVLERARDSGLTQVEGVIATAEDTGLAPNSIDLIFVSNTFHHLPDPPDYFANIRPVLRRGGRIAIIELKGGGFPKGHDTAPDVIREDMRAAGFTLAKSYDFLERQSFQIFVPE